MAVINNDNERLHNFMRHVRDAHDLPESSVINIHEPSFELTLLEPEDMHLLKLNITFLDYRSFLQWTTKIKQQAFDAGAAQGKQSALHEIRAGIRTIAQDFFGIILK